MTTTSTHPHPAEQTVRRLPKHLPMLDGIRGIAILMVMFSHLIDGGASKSAIVRGVTGVIHGGWAGVDLFFVLSGFLITGILLDTRGDPHYFRNFYARRTLRIFPLYYGALAVVFLVLPLAGHFDTPGLRSLMHNQAWLWLYGTNLRIGYAGNFADFNKEWVWLSHFWSLAVEEHFYLIWPTVVFFCCRKRGLLAGVCMACIVAVFLGRTVAGAMGVNSAALYVLTPFRVDSLIMGGLAATLARGRQGLAPLAKPAFLLLAISGIALLIIRYFDHATVGEDGRSSYFTPLGVFFASSLILAVTADKQAGGVRAAAVWLLAHPILRLFGRYSYGLYVIESMMQPLYERFFSTQMINAKLGNFLVAGLMHLLFCLGSTLLLAVTSFHLYEKPFLRLKRFFEAERHAHPPLV